LSGREKAMSAVKRKVYGAAFKGKVGLEAIRGLKTINEIAQEQGGGQAKHPGRF
jgi:hypothetical protein